MNILLRPADTSMYQGHDRVYSWHHVNGGASMPCFQVEYYHIQSIARIRNYLTTAACRTTVHALFHYGNVLFYSLSETLLHKLQMVQNSAARLITETRRRDHVTPVLFSRHCWPVRQRIVFVILLLVYHAIHRLDPEYVTTLVTPYSPTLLCHWYLLASDYWQHRDITLSHPRDL